MAKIINRPVILVESVEDLDKLGYRQPFTIVCKKCGCLETRKYRKEERHRYLKLFCSKCQQKQTMLDVYGVDNASKSEKLLEKRKITWINKYGVDNPSKSEKILNKIKQTNINRRGFEWASSDPEVKKKKETTCLRLYGCKTSLIDPCVKLKIEKTNLRLYGEKIPINSTVIRNKIIKNRKYIYNNLSFDSFPEFSVYLFCIYNNIPIIRNPNISFQLLDMYGNIRYVYPDFIISGRLVEIKGSMFYKPDGTWYLPWKGNLSDEKYLYECDLKERKRQCLLSNNVLILRDIDSFVLQCINWVNIFFSNQFIYQFQKSNPNNFCYGATPYNKSNNKYTDIPGIGCTVFNRNRSKEFV